MRFFQTISAGLSLVLTTQAAIDTTKYPKSIKLTYEILGSTSANSNTKHPLAEIFYNPETTKSHLSSWTPPSTDHLQSTSSDPTSAPLVRISLPDGTSTVASLSAFDSSLSQYINLWLSSSSSSSSSSSETDATIFSASISSISPPPLTDEEQRQKRKEERARAKGKPMPSPKSRPKQSKSKAKKEDSKEENTGPIVKVNIIRAREGVKPALVSRAPPQIDAEGREVVPPEQQEKSFFQKYWWVFMAATVLLMSGGGGAAEK